MLRLVYLFLAFVLLSACAGVAQLKAEHNTQYDCDQHWKYIVRISDEYERLDHVIEKAEASGNEQALEDAMFLATCDPQD